MTFQLTSTKEETILPQAVPLQAVYSKSVLNVTHGLSASAQNVADVSRRFANFRISGANLEQRSVKSEPVGFTESQAEGTLPAQVQSRRKTEFHLSQENVVTNGNWDISSVNSGNRRQMSMVPQDSDVLESWLVKYDKPQASVNSGILPADYNRSNDPSMRIPAIKRGLGAGMAHTDNHRSYPGMAYTDNHRSYPGTQYRARETVHRRYHYGDLHGLHGATIKSRIFPASYHERDLTKDAGLEKFCNMSYAGTRDVGTSRNGFQGAYEVLNFLITIDFFENYSYTVIKFLSKYRHHSTFYQILYFPVTFG